MKLLERLTALFRPRTVGDAFAAPGDPGLNGMNDRLPDDLVSIISQEAYTWVVAETLRRLGRGRHIFRLDGGLLFYTQVDGRSWMQVNLVHLVQQLLLEERSAWQDRIAGYLDRHREDQVALESLLTSFQAAREKLTVRLHTEATYERFPLRTEGYLLKAVIPDLYAALALELPGQFHILQRTEIAHWEIDEDELLWTAYANLADQRDKIKVVEQEGEGFSILTLLEGDYAASFAIDFANHCSEWIGKLGAIVSLPTKGVVFIYPVNDPAVFNGGFTRMAELANRYFQEGPSPLTNDLFWFHYRLFERCPKAIEGHTLTYSIPNRLLAYLRTPLAHPAYVSEVKDALLEGDWEGYFEYGQGFPAPLVGTRREFQMVLRSKWGQLEGSCTDEEQPAPAGIWGFVDRELISFIKKHQDRSVKEIHYTGFFDAGERSFMGTWVIDEGNGKVVSGSWAMVKL